MMKRKIIGFLVAPLVALTVFLVIGLIESVYWQFVGVEKYNDPSDEVLFFACLFIGLPAVYGLAIIAGLPLILIYSRFKLLGLPYFAGGGMVIGLAVGLGMCFFIDAFDSAIASAYILIVFAASSVAATTSFWYISIKERSGVGDIIN